MKIGFITTINTNIGDDFIRTGIENILYSLKDKSEIKFTYVNKHKPETEILKNSIFGFLYKLPNFKGRRTLIRKFENHYTYLNYFFKNQDLIIQSGAPVLWQGCEKNEWALPIWYNAIGKLKGKMPILNLAAGSCYPWENQKAFYESPAEIQYAKDLGSFCNLTTTRDKLANELFSYCGVDNVLMPCTAFFVDKNFENNNESRYVLINYMEGGGHFDWGQKIDKEVWEKTIISLISELKKDHEIRFICHSNEEVKLAKKIAPDLMTCFPQNVEEYLECIKYAKLGINNRMHASVAMASVGVPSISVCTDTRLLMLENIGAKFHYVKDLSEELLINEAKSLIENLKIERVRLFSLKKEKFEQYRQLIKKYV